MGWIEISLISCSVALGGVIFLLGYNIGWSANESLHTGRVTKGGRVEEKPDWLIVSRSPQFVYGMGVRKGDGTYENIHTGWRKVPDEDLWYRVKGEKFNPTTIEQERKKGAVCYPGETPKECAQRRGDTT
jgi:hypothetical protein